MSRFRQPLRPFRIDDKTQPITVYRVEHGQSTIGPYNHERDVNNTRRDVTEFMRLVDGSGVGTHQPTASYDIPGLTKWLVSLNKLEPEYDDFFVNVLGMMHMKYVRFGFRHLAQLRAWFGDSFLALAQEGYVIAKYEILPAGLIDGHNQVAFHTFFAKRVGIVPFVDAMTNVPTLPRYVSPQFAFTDTLAGSRAEAGNG